MTHIFDAVGVHRDADLSLICSCGANRNHMIHIYCQIKDCNNKAVGIYNIDSKPTPVCSDCSIRGS